MLGPLEMDFGEGDLPGDAVLQMVAEIEDREGDRVFRHLPADLSLDVRRVLREFRDELCQLVKPLGPPAVRPSPTLADRQPSVTVFISTYRPRSIDQLPCLSSHPLGGFRLRGGAYADDQGRRGCRASASPGSCHGRRVEGDGSAKLGLGNRLASASVRELANVSPPVMPISMPHRRSIGPGAAPHRMALTDFEATISAALILPSSPAPPSPVSGSRHRHCPSDRSLAAGQVLEQIAGTAARQAAARLREPIVRTARVQLRGGRLHLAADAAHVSSATC